jgi:adenylate cyclase class IV
MPLEYEYVFRNYNKLNIIKNIKKYNGYKVGHYIFKVMVFIHPLNKEGSYIRVRDEGHQITMTYKHFNKKNKFADEHEINIDNFDNAVNILLGLGCTTKYYYEKLREIWNIKNSEIVFDINPGVPERMEVESPTLKELDYLTKKLDLFDYKLDGSELSISQKLFGFNISKNILSLTFLNVKKLLLPLVTKNKSDFIDLIKQQKKLYNNVLKLNKK